MRKKFLYSQVSSGTWKRGVAPLIPLIVSAVILVSAVAVSFFYQEDTRTYRSSAAHPTLTPIKSRTPTPPCKANGVNCNLGSECCSKYCEGTSGTCRNPPSTPTKTRTPTPQLDPYKYCPDGTPENGCCKLGGQCADGGVFKDYCTLPNSFCPGPTKTPTKVPTRTPTTAGCTPLGYCLRSESSVCCIGSHQQNATGCQYRAKCVADLTPTKTRTPTKAPTRPAGCALTCTGGLCPNCGSAYSCVSGYCVRSAPTATKIPTTPTKAPPTRTPTPYCSPNGFTCSISPQCCNLNCSGGYCGGAPTRTPTKVPTRTPTPKCYIFCTWDSDCTTCGSGYSCPAGNCIIGPTRTPTKVPPTKTPTKPLLPTRTPTKPPGGGATSTPTSPPPPPPTSTPILGGPSPTRTRTPTPVCNVSVLLTAIPNQSTSSSLSNVDLKAAVSGGSGSIRYRFFCNSSSTTWNREVSTSTNPYTAVDLCSYSGGGYKTALVSVLRSNCTITGTTTISLGGLPSPTNTRIPTRTPTLRLTRTPTPPGGTTCTTACTGWQDSGCAGGNCGNLQMYQTRSCSISGCITTRCTSSTQCSTVPTRTPTPFIGSSPTPGQGAAGLIFMVRLPDVSAGSIQASDVQIELRNGGNLVETANVELFNNGTYYQTANAIFFNSALNQSYTVFVKTSISLGRAFAGVSLSQSQILDCTVGSDPACGGLTSQIDSKVLESGDSDGFNTNSGSYNRIDSADLQVVSTYFNIFVADQPAAAVADYNYDGIVDISDLDIVGKNHGLQGD